MSLNSDQYRDALEKALADRDLRILLWRIVVEDCKVFQEGFPMNAGAYALLALQDTGKRLLADMKSVDPMAVYQAEQEYNELMRQSEAADTPEDDLYGDS
jgi:hypothetical protein